MPTTLTTTLRHIYDKVPNPVNSKLIEVFQSNMQGNTTSERNQINNLKAIIALSSRLVDNLV